MFIELLFSIIGILFWPAIILLVILWLRRRRGERRRQESEELAGLWDRLESVARQVDDVAARMGRLEARVGDLARPAGLAAPAATELPAEAVPTAEAAAAPILVEEVPVQAPPAAPAGPPVERRALAEIIGVEPTAPPAEVVVAEEAPVSALAARRKELVERFLENWTGILGAVVVVAGVTFVGIYTALRMAPFYRFLMTVAAAGVLLGTSVVLARREHWRDFAGWLRSAGAAILLFACAAAGGLPGLGLQWIHAPIPALALLLAGIAANLYLAYAGGTQVFATLHVLLSLLPLALVPANTVALAIASAVAVFGVGMKPRERWDLHVAIVLGAYLLFHLLWFAGMGDRLDPEAARLIAAGCAALVFCAAALVHYRKDCAAREPAPLQVAVHLGNWALLALATFVYVPIPLVRGLVLLAAAAFAYRLAQRARRVSIAWLHRTDLLTAQGFVLLALTSGLDLGASLTLVLLIAFVETLAFRLIVPREQDSVLDRVCDALPLVAAVLLVLVGFQNAVVSPENTIEVAFELLAGAVIAVAGQKALGAPPEAAEPSFRTPRTGAEAVASAGIVLGWLAGVLVVVAVYALYEQPWLEGVALVSVGGLLFAARRLRRAGLLAGTLVALVGTHVVSWLSLTEGNGLSALALTSRIVPLMTLAALTTWLAGVGSLRLAAIALLGIDAGLAAYLYFDPVSALIPGVAWLMLSLVALEIADRLRGRDAETVLALGYGYLAAFVLAYALVIVQTPAYVGAVSARLLIELFALGVLAYWWFFRPRGTLVEVRRWTLVHPLFLELLLVGVAVTVVVEVAAQWWAVAWAVIALLLLGPVAEKLLDVRARFYSLLFYWVSVADMAFVVSVMVVPSSRLVDQPEFTSLVAIGLQVAYVAWAHGRLRLDALATPPPTALVGRLADLVAARRNLYVYYPLFAGIAIFLYWRFDRSLLTLLWSAEAFVVFVLSAWLRENQFRYVALAGLAACLARLVLIDMAQANLALRGVVFIGVGLLMLGMNAIYNRYRARFQA